MSNTRLLRPWRQPRLLLLAWLLLIGAVVVGSLLPSATLPEPSFAGIDKVEHLAAYAVLSAGAVLLFVPARAQLLAAVALVALGASLEAAQAAWTTSRLADPADMAANTLGVVLGWWVGRKMVARLRLPDGRQAG
ncbi:VanZ family protein [Aerolutibacter ruishenii]|uniref:VanZ family protein n=1 Tax=Aerolutibacter ruishenii TaxID=686800 RepID=A0A562LGV5_9GAMM|nr:VanZ family protein [Lysobacter ruishenii]TWI06826.1 VanZ family protein [Lysobacter ruishenii]